MALPFLRCRLSLGLRLIGRFLYYPRTMLAAAVFGLIAWFGGFGVFRRSLPQRPSEESDDDNDSVTVSTEVTEGEVEQLEPSVIHRDATPSGSEGEVPIEATPSAVGTRAEDPICQDVESVKRPITEEDVDEEDFESSEYLVDYTDEFCCEYDSTWEMSRSHSQSTDRPRSSNYHKFGRFRNAARDMQNFRHNYPEKTRYKQWNQEEYHMPNLDFYLGNRASSPDGIYMDEFHNKWFGDYYKLERVHTFIQWLFPLQEPGVNYEAVELTKKEIEAFLEDDVAKANLRKSYELMLDFYGIELSNMETGEVQRASNWEERFANLNRNTHNNQRITRILKCLGTLGFAHYQAPLVRFFLHETLVNEVLPAVKESVLNYFLFAVLDKRRRRSLIKFAYKNYKPREEFVWCPRKIQMAWSTEPVERYSDMHEKPINQSPSECSLPSQDDLPAEFEETGEDVNPKPIHPNSADESNDTMAESQMNAN